jgi:beta-galactosidase
VASPADTFLDMSAFGKGFAWVNGHNLGRIWDIGPQRSLYLPAPWMEQGDNTVVVFDLQAPNGRAVRGATQPVWYESDVKTAK